MPFSIISFGLGWFLASNHYKPIHTSTTLNEQDNSSTLVASNIESSSEQHMFEQQEHKEPVSAEVYAVK